MTDKPFPSPLSDKLDQPKKRDWLTTLGFIWLFSGIFVWAIAGIYAYLILNDV